MMHLISERGPTDQALDVKLRSLLHFRLRV